MTTVEDVQQLQKQYGADWIVRIIHGKVRATRRRTLTAQEIQAGMAIVIADGEGGTLTDLLERQARTEQALRERAADIPLTSTP